MSSIETYVHRQLFERFVINFRQSAVLILYTFESDVIGSFGLRTVTPALSLSTGRGKVCPALDQPSIDISFIRDVPRIV